MGGSSGGGTTTQTTELAPEQRAIMTNLTNRYFPNDQATAKPQFGAAGQRAAGETRVAPFNATQNNAFDLTKQSAFQHQGGIGEAANLSRAGTAVGAGSAQQTDLGSGWTQGQNGNAQFADFNADTMSDFMNPYTENVTNVGLRELQRTRDIAQRDNNLNAAGASAFGGSRHALINSETDRNFLDMGQKFLAESLNTGYESGRDQYNQAHGQGMQQLGHNMAAGQQASNALTQGSNQIAALTQQLSNMDQTGINAIKSVGDAEQSLEQSIRDAGYNDALQNELWDAQLGQIISGFTPPPTQVSTSSGSGGSNFGSILGGLVAGAGAIFSDERVKHDIEDADPDEALDDIRKLIPKTYRYNADVGHADGTTRRRGFMAQDAEKTKGIKVIEEDGVKKVDVQSTLETTIHAIQAIDRKLNKISEAA